MTQHSGLGTARYGLLGHGKHHHQSVTLLHRQSNAVNQTVTVFLVNYQFLYYNLDIVVAVTVQFHAGLYLTKFAVHTHGQIALAADALEQFLVMSLTVANQRCQHVYALSVIVAQYQVDDLLLGELDHLLTAQV